VLVYITTLEFWQIMETAAQCITRSTPDSIAQIVGTYRKFGATPEIGLLARDIVRMQCRPYSSQHSAYVIKFNG